jgi:hypothetical protein
MSASGRKKARLNLRIRENLLNSAKDMVDDLNEKRGPDEKRQSLTRICTEAIEEFVGEKGLDAKSI